MLQVRAARPLKGHRVHKSFNAEAFDVTFWAARRAPAPRSAARTPLEVQGRGLVRELISPLEADAMSHSGSRTTRGRTSAVRSQCCG